MRYFVAVSFVLVLFLSVTTRSVSTSTLVGHGCAPLILRGVSGTPAPAPAAPGVIAINEVLPLPHSTWNCSETPGHYSFISDAWIELYNIQNQPYNLYTAHAEIDSGPNTNFYHLPFGASIAAHGFIVLFPRYDTGFLSTVTSTLRLIIGSTVVDQVTIPQLAPDQSYARTADGTSTWQVANAPTIDASNVSFQATPTVTSPSNGQNGSGGNTTNPGYNGNTPTNTSKTLVDGAQPQWSKLQLPTAIPTSALNTAPTTIATSPSSPGNITALPLRIALTVLLILLALTMLWCWRVFFKT